MNARNRLAALLAAGSLVMALAAVTSAGPPTYSLSVDKSANPANVPVAGTSVVYTIAVAATGTGFFGTVNVDDGMAGCTLAGPTGDTDTDANLDPGETWSYTCTVTGVVPDTANTATVIACHNSSGACNQATQDATASDTFTVGTGPDITEPPASEPPASEPPASEPPASEPPASEPPASEPPASEPPASAPPASVNPSADVADDVDATMPSSDTAIGGGAAKPADRSWMLVVALGMLLASIVVVSPSRTAREERE
ncbi:MAG TPA: hypothetical protein VFP56_12860 [Candidatus Limnocylindrales bacterium]|nr:hypothetical protein [Candidatus Limnocylindrales bacterium]